MSYTWLVVAGILLLLELSTGTFYLLMLAVASLITWFAMQAGAGFLAQAIVFLISAALLVYITRSVRAQQSKHDTPSLADNLDAGEHIHVEQWQDRVGRTHYRGAQWAVVLDDDDEEALTDGSYIIVRLDGTRVRVARIEQ